MVNAGEHYELRILWGVPVTPLDTASAEQGIRSISLTEPSGFCVLAEGGYTPQRPSTKNGGVWLDSALTDGRIPILESESNVTETIQLTLSSGSINSLNMQLLQLDWFIDQVGLFWTTARQIQPIYLMHQVVAEPGPRFALIRNMEYSVDDPDSLETPMRYVTLTIEREPFWRGIPPGANPKMWTFYSRDGDMSNFTVNSADLGRGTDALVVKTINNRMEFNPATYLTTYSQNYVDIPANLIPGDAPALAFIDVSANGNSPSNAALVMCGRSTKPTVVVNRANAGSSKVDLQQTTRIPTTFLNAGDGQVGTDTTLQTTATSGGGNISNGTTGTRAFSRTTFATATDQTRMTFGVDNYTTDIHILRGEYVAFIRARQNAGAFGNITMYLRVNYSSGVQQVSLLPTNPIVSSGGVSEWYLHYLGVVNIPLSEDRTAVSMEGWGVNVDNVIPTISFDLQASRASGVATLDLLDLFLLPKDEGAFILNNDSGLGMSDFVSDTTGYLSRGRPQFAGYLVDKDSINGGYDAAPYQANTQGTPLTLDPQVNNRLYFVTGVVDTATNNLESRPDEVTDIRVNIVPRWSGLRDV